MTLSEAKALKRGDKIYINLGNGWRQHGEFVRLVEITRFPKMTFADIAGFDPSKGKKETHIMFEYVDDKGNKKSETIAPRKAHRE